MIQKIDFVENLTSLEACKYIGRLYWVIVKNIGRLINKIVHRFPWVVILTTIVVCFIICFVQISKARAERDSYSHDLVRTQQQLENYKVMYDTNTFHHE